MTSCTTRVGWDLAALKGHAQVISLNQTVHGLRSFTFLHLSRFFLGRRNEQPGSADEDSMAEIAMFDEHRLPRNHHHSLLPQRLLQKTLLALHPPKGHLQVHH